MMEGSKSPKHKDKCDKMWYLQVISLVQNEHVTIFRVIHSDRCLKSPKHKDKCDKMWYRQVISLVQNEHITIFRVIHCDNKFEISRNRSADVIEYVFLSRLLQTIGTAQAKNC